MRLSRDKINHISHLITKHLAEDESVTFLKENNEIRLNVLHVILNELELDDKIEAAVLKRIASYSRKIAEGSQEWQILYQKFYDDEMNKLGRL